MQHGVASQPCFSSICYNERSNHYTDQSTSLQITTLCLMFMEVYTMKNLMHGTQLQNPYAAYLQWLICPFDLESVWTQAQIWKILEKHGLLESQVHRLKRCGDEKFIIQKAETQNDPFFTLWICFWFQWHLLYTYWFIFIHNYK